MSFDQLNTNTQQRKLKVSIPFDQDNVFRPTGSLALVELAVSLNPFRSGQCLSTFCWFSISYFCWFVSIPFEQGDVFRQNLKLKQKHWVVSIPFEQGDVFRLLEIYTLMQIILKSQSLSNRAMSFDLQLLQHLLNQHQSQSLSNRAMSFDEDNCSSLRSN